MSAIISFSGSEGKSYQSAPLTRVVSDEPVPIMKSKKFLFKSTNTDNQPAPLTRVISDDPVPITKTKKFYIKVNNKDKEPTHKPTLAHSNTLSDSQKQSAPQDNHSLHEIYINSRSASNDEFRRLSQEEESEKAKKAYPILGKKINDPSNQHRIGRRYLEGDPGFVKKDPELGVYWITKAATRGDRKSQKLLASAYKKGDLVEQNKAVAEYWALQSKK